MRVKAFLYRQGGMTLLTTVLPAGLVMSISRVPRFGDEAWGYQRPVLKRHVGQICNYVLESDPSPVLPTAVVLGANAEDVDYDVVEESTHASHAIVELKLGSDKPRPFRVIDGQHRLLGINEAARVSTRLMEYPLPINILVVDGEENYPTEIDTFIDINSKAKRIKTDLAILARHQLELRGREGRPDFVEYICTEIGYLLNSDPESSWYNAITVHLKEPGIISISAWNRSLQDMVSYLLQKRYGVQDFYEVTECDELAHWVRNLLHDIWTSVEGRWPECFLPLADDEEEELWKRYSEEYVLQKPIGVFAVHLYLTDLIKEDEDKARSRLMRALKKTNIESEDWRVGKRFKGMTSLGAFKRVKEEVFGV